MYKMKISKKKQSKSVRRRLSQLRPKDSWVATSASYATGYLVIATDAIQSTLANKPLVAYFTYEFVSTTAVRFDSYKTIFLTIVTA